MLQHPPYQIVAPALRLIPGADLILMDVMMPKMDGYSSCYALKREPATRSIPIIILSALDLKLNLELGKEIGADGYITKPFNSQNLLDNIAQVLPTA